MVTSVGCKVSNLQSVGRPLKAVHNQLPSRYRSHKAIYSNFSPKTGCHGNVPQHLCVYGLPFNTIPWAHPSRQPKRHLDRFSRFCIDDRRVFLYFTMERPFPRSKLSLPMGESGPHLIHGSLVPPESSTQTASRSVQSFCRAH